MKSLFRIAFTLAAAAFLAGEVDAQCSGRGRLFGRRERAFRPAGRMYYAPMRSYGSCGPAGCASVAMPSPAVMVAAQPVQRPAAATPYAAAPAPQRPLADAGQSQE